MRSLGKYGRMHKRYLLEHRSLLFNQLLLSGNLMKHLYSIDDACQEHIDLLIPQMKVAEGVAEELCHIANRHELPARACLPKNQMEVLMKKLLKPPSDRCPAPHCDSAGVIGLTSIATNLLGAPEQGALHA